MSLVRKGLLTFGATAALTGAFAVNGTIDAEAAVWEARTVEEVKNDIQSTGEETSYTIQWGDTLGTISKALDMSVGQIVDMNEVANRDLIIAGNTLHLSTESDTVSVEDNATHEVQTFEVEEAPEVEEATEPVEETTEAPVEEVEEPAEETTEAPVEEVEAPAEEETAEEPVEEETAAEAPEEENTTAEAPANGSESDAKEWIAERESNGSYTAYNPAGGYYGRYQLNPSLIDHGASPEEQEAAADDYVADRYGSWSEAQSFWESKGWY